MRLPGNNKLISFDIFTFDCNGCEECIRHCKRNVLRLVDNGYCRYAIVQHPEKCSTCGKCIKVCKTQAMKMVIKECS